MKVIYNNIIPFPNYQCMNLFGILFARKNAKIDDATLNHESIHTAQMKELLYVPFYLLYGAEWLVKFIKNGFKGHTAYRNLSFEKEAYNNEHDLNYLKTRQHYAEWK